MNTEIKILIAEDNTAMQSMLKNVLSSYGYENVTTVSNGEGALYKYHFNTFHMVMLDISMPIKNGLQVLEAIRLADPTIFIVMVSADGSAETIKTTLDLGVNGYVVKPYTATKFKGIIQKFNDHLLSHGLTPASLP